MERKGSGFGKIISEYELQINCIERKNIIPFRQILVYGSDAESEL